MIPAPPLLRQFRVEPQDNGLVHLVFDAPGRTMNVFSNAAIGELGQFAAWLAGADVRGVVIRSGKDTAFCAGADLAELGAAYDTIMAAPPPARFNRAFDHFFPLSQAIRALETSGKPVAAAIAGLALGGGCELAMGAHHRVLADDPRAALGLPESMVGLLPGGGGTQRLPRLTPLSLALPILLEGRRLAGHEALRAGLVDQVVPAGQEVAAAEAWLLSGPSAVQPWDRPSWKPADALEVCLSLTPARDGVIAQTLGHYPAPLAILECLEFGLPQAFEGAIRSEMAIFADLIQRQEPRNMIQSLFLGKMDYERRARRGDIPSYVAEVVGVVRSVLAARPSEEWPALARAGFTAGEGMTPTPARRRMQAGFWVETETSDVQAQAALSVLRAIAAAVAPMAIRLGPDQKRLADYAVIQEIGYPAYLGGPFAYTPGV